MTAKETVTAFIDFVANPIIAAGVLALFLIIIGIFDFAHWGILFTIILSYFVADWIGSFFVGGGHGATQIPILGNLIQERGHAYLSFVIAIILGTLFSGLISDRWLGWLGMFSDSSQRSLMLVFASVFIVIVSYADFHWRCVD